MVIQTVEMWSMWILCQILRTLKTHKLAQQEGLNVPVINVHNTNNDENKEYLDAGGTGRIPETIKVFQENSWEYSTLHDNLSEWSACASATKWPLTRHCFSLFPSIVVGKGCRGSRGAEELRSPSSMRGIFYTPPPLTRERKWPGKGNEKE